MNPGSFWEWGGTYLTVLTPLVVVPLTVLTFYLRGVREQQVKHQGETARRLDMLDAAATHLRQSIADVVRDYATKEEWLRECMHARRRIELLTETAVRLETLCDFRRQSAAPTGESSIAS